MMVSPIEALEILLIPVPLLLLWAFARWRGRRRALLHRPTPVVREQQRRRAWLAEQDDFVNFPFPEDRG